MEVLFVLIGISMIVAGFFLVAFLLNVKKGQYDDIYTPSARILFENKMNDKLTENETR